MKRQSFIKSIFAILAIPFIPILKPKPIPSGSIYKPLLELDSKLIDIDYEEWKMLANAFTEHELKQWESSK